MAATQAMPPGSTARREQLRPATRPERATRRSSWIDSSGNLWLFGGYGYDSTGTVGKLNDLWQYSPTTEPVDLDQRRQR